jgi:hypothetical protein
VFISLLCLCLLLWLHRAFPRVHLRRPSAALNGDRVRAPPRPAANTFPPLTSHLWLLRCAGALCSEVKSSAPLAVSSSCSSSSIASGPAPQLDQKVGLPPVASVTIGLSWDTPRKGSIGLDASCVLFDTAGAYITTVYFDNPTTETCAVLDHKPVIVHSGDVRSELSGDDERITVHLNQVRPVARPSVSPRLIL